MILVKLLFFVLLSAAIPNQAIAQTCNHDMYFLIDASSSIDQNECATILFPFLPKSWTQWLSWRKSVGAVLEFFAQDAETSAINGGVQLWGAEAVTIGNYDVAPNFTTAIMDLKTRPTPVCGGTSNWVELLGQAIHSNAQFANWGYEGPTSLRPFETTTFTAIVFVTSDMFLSLSNLEERMSFIRPQLDNLIIITDTMSNAAQDSIKEQQIRLAACGNATATSCPFIFYLNKPNDGGVPLSSQAIRDVIDVERCNSRNIARPNFTASCSVESVTFTIPLDLLGELTAGDLVALNATCDLSTMSSVFGADLLIVIPFGECGSVTQEDGENTIMFQQVMTGNPNLPFVEFNASCIFPTTINDFVGALKPQGIILNQNISKLSSYSLSMELFSDAGFTNLVTQAAPIVIGCNVFVEANSVLQQGVRLVTTMCYATPSSDPNDAVTYDLVTSGCRQDPTLFFLAQPTPHTVRFVFDMFEFASGVGKPSAQKPLVYIHCMFRVCMDSDTTDACNPICATSRRKRQNNGENNDVENVITKTIGPFYVDDNKSSVESDQKQRGESGNVNVDQQWWQQSQVRLITPSFVSSLYSVIGHAVFLLACGLTVIVLMRKFKGRSNESYVNTIPGVVPYRCCSKECSNLPNYYHKSEELPVQCKTCYDNLPTSVGVVPIEIAEGVKREDPPQYVP